MTLKQSRINCLNEQAFLEVCEWVMRTSTSRSASIYLAFQIHALLQLDLPDVEPPVEKGTHFSLQKQIDSLTEITAPGGLHTGNDVLFSVSSTFGGLSGDDYSGECGLSDSVTVYGCTISSQGPVENGAWRLSLGYSDILPHG